MIKAEVNIQELILPAIIAVLVAALGLQSCKASSLERRLSACETNIDRAALESRAKAETSGEIIVRQKESADAQAAPVVTRVVERIRNVCLQDEGRVQVSSASADIGGGGVQTQDPRDRVTDDAFVAALGDDIRGCQKELTRLQAVLDFVEANQ